MAGGLFQKQALEIIIENHMTLTGDENECFLNSKERGKCKIMFMLICLSKKNIIDETFSYHVYAALTGHQTSELIFCRNSV